jgi:hypothetical protein
MIDGNEGEDKNTINRLLIIQNIIRSDKMMESSTEKVCELLNSLWSFYLSGEAVPPVRKTKPVDNWKDF